MARFIKVADTKSSCDFVNLDHVTEVWCNVVREKRGGGFDIRSVTDPSISPNTPAEESVTAVIELHTVSGKSEVRFMDLDEAGEWANEHLGIFVPFDQL